MAKYKNQQGFTLVEVLIAMAIISAISLVAMGAITPWIGFKQKLDTERKLQDVKNGMMALYDARAMAVEAQGSGQFVEFSSSVPATGVDGLLRCDSQLGAFNTNSTVFNEFPQQLSIDGYANPWCIFISPGLNEIRDNVTLWYRNIAVVSLGPNGTLDAGTSMAANGLLTVAGDDVGVSVSGREIQAPKLKETLRRLNRAGQLYEGYFTARFLARADRDITRYYFTDGLSSTGSGWTPIATGLAAAGMGGVEVNTPWEVYSPIELNNGSGSAGGVTVRSPSTTGTGVLPYTALLRARVPGPSSSPQYAVQVVMGNY